MAVRESIRDVPNVTRPVPIHSGVLGEALGFMDQGFSTMARTLCQVSQDPASQCHSLQITPLTHSPMSTSTLGNDKWKTTRDGMEITKLLL